MSDTLRAAAIDIGTVTTRLLVGDVGPAGIAEVERSTDITHLGEGLTSTGGLSPEAIDRVAAVLRRYAERMEALGVESYSALATSASRDASNSGAFLAALQAVGIDAEVIEGQREAALSFLGATYDVEGEGLLVVDLGGGSTELIAGGAREMPAGRDVRIDSAASVDVGSRRITERFMGSDPPTTAEIERARTHVAAELSAYFESLEGPPRVMISVAGTATTLAAIRAGMDVYDPERIHGSSLTRDDLSELLATLAGMPLVSRREVAGLHPGRAPVIVAGTLILGEVLRLAGLRETTVSEHDILYGILLDTYGAASR
jgi:exopolyphosphatase/guanosine-5'-triphosphate,3'-diphosphate pyrophosphatase